MIPKQVKKRHPDELVLATFRIPYQKWEQFQEAASASGTTASATLLAFIEDYLARFNAGNQPVESLLQTASAVTGESHLPEQSPVSGLVTPSETSETEVSRGLSPENQLEIQKILENQFEEKIEAKLEAKLEAKFEDIELIMDRIQSQMNQLSRRLGKVEQIVEKFKETKSKNTSDFIDVDAVPIDSELNQPDLDRDSARGDPDANHPLTEDDENDIGLTQTALCIEFGINPNTLNRHARVRGLSTVEYLHQLTGWLYRNGKYYPPK